MSLKNMRRAKGWSQEQLADISGVSIRTIQRLEAGEGPGLETQKALAAAFEQSLNEFNTQISVPDQAAEDDVSSPEADQSEAVIARYGWKGLLSHLGVMMAVITWLYFLAREFDIHQHVVNWVFFMWGFALLGHAVSLFSDRN